MNFFFVCLRGSSFWFWLRQVRVYFKRMSCGHLSCPRPEERLEGNRLRARFSGNPQLVDGWIPTKLVPVQTGKPAGMTSQKSILCIGNPDGGQVLFSSRSLADLSYQPEIYFKAGVFVDRLFGSGFAGLGETQ